MALRYVFHVSDLHIRNGDVKMCRYQEYNDVFDRLFTSAKSKICEMNLTYDNYVFVVSGDIFHNKNTIGNYGLMLYKKFLKNLTHIGRTIVFHGNHDRNQNEVDQPSLVSSTMEIENLILLDKTTVFSIDDVEFSYVSIDDTLDSYSTCGRIDDLPAFPRISQTGNKNIKHKIAMFHGTFANVKLYNGIEVSDEHKPYPFEWLKDFDFAILGDIHLRQYGIANKKTLWGYSGSLVQQNYGEDIVHHGYMIWDLDNRKIEEINIYNDIGLINIKQDDGDIKIRIRGKYENLESFIERNKEEFPKNLEIKLYSDIDIPMLIALMKKYSISFNIVSNRIPGNSIISPKDIETSDRHDMKDLDIHIDKNTILKYFHEILSDTQHNILSGIVRNNDNLLFDISTYPIELHEDCIKKNKDISALINECLKSDGVKNTHEPFIVKYLEWENMYCYESGNHIDFSKMDNSTFLISGNNGMGKSAIYDILTLAIWGDITTNKQSSISTGIINSKHTIAHTKIDIQCGKNMYRIHRKFYINAHNILKKQIKLFDANDASKDILLKKDNACTEEIKNLFGTLEEFLASSMITQNVDFDILKMSYKDCLAVIDKATNIDYVYNLYSLFKGCLNKYKDLKKIIESKKQVYEGLMKSNEYDQNFEENIDINSLESLKSLKSDIESMQLEKDALEIQSNSIMVDINCKETTKLVTSFVDDNTEYVQDITEIEYETLKEQLNEIRVIFKDISEKEIKSLKRHLSENGCDDFDISVRVAKPCEQSFIKSEETILEKYKEAPQKRDDIDANALKRSKDELLEIEKMLKITNDNKPATIENPKESLESITKIIDKYYDSFDVLEKYCSDNYKKGSGNEGNDKKAGKISYDVYQSTENDKKILKEHLEKCKSDIVDFDAKINNLYETRSNIDIVAKPSRERSEGSEGSETCLDDMKEKLEKLKKDTVANDIVLEKFFKEYDDILGIENTICEYQKELDMLMSKEEYEYDPGCVYCCKRPWVCRMKEIERSINNLQKTVKKYYENDDYNSNTDLHILNESMKADISEIELHLEWDAYDTYVNSCDMIKNELRESIAMKEDIVKKLKEYDETMAGLMEISYKFNRQSHDLYEKYCKIKAYCNYLIWKKEYDAIVENKEKAEKNVASMEEYLRYDEEIRPRIEKLRKLKNKYRKWECYDMKYKLVKLNEIGEIEKKIQKYNDIAAKVSARILKSQFVAKQDMTHRIKLLDNDIKKYQEIVTKYEISAMHIEKNAKSYDMLMKAMDNIKSIIDVMEIIIDKFKVYRKELYENHILRNLVAKSNDYIKHICHEDTKQFSLDYKITEIKDIIHINWLVKADQVAEEESKHIVSVHQASGFQQFVISLALRMSLFSNKTCNQLFFDEGFTACDKLNLSIVPSFLKGLLKVFNSVIVVSHIDIIQDSVDDVARITYDNDLGCSNVVY
jgi:exonuclease SbcC